MSRARSRVDIVDRGQRGVSDKLIRSRRIVKGIGSATLRRSGDTVDIVSGDDRTVVASCAEHHISLPASGP
jgi:hypothetical protein